MSSSIYLAGVTGVILLHSSQCRPKNTTSIIIANLLSLAVGTIAFWACGYAFAIGEGANVGTSSNFFLSHKRFFLIDGSDNEYGNFASELLHVYLVLIICNSGFICRLRHWIYPILAVFVAGFTYPCVRHWTYHSKGWLRDGIEIDRDNKKQDIIYTDLFGAGSIHVFAGSVAFLGTILLAPRKDRKGQKFKPIGGLVTPLILVGGLLASAAMLVKNSSGTSSPNIAVTNNLLSAQASAIVSYTLKRFGVFGDKSRTKAIVNGALAGFVAMSCQGDTYHAYGAFVVGIVAGLAFVAWTTLLQMCHVDDPTDTISIHLGAGLLSLLAGPLFNRYNGVLYDGDKERFETFGWHLLGGLAIFVWGGLTIFLLIIILVASGVAVYRNDSAHERGLDAHEHDEPAYPNREHYTQDDDVIDNSTSINAELKNYTNGLFQEYRPRASRKPEYPTDASLQYPERTWQNQTKY